MFKSFISGVFPLEDSNFGQNNCLTDNFLYCEFQLSMFSSLKVLFRGAILGGSSPRKFSQINCLTNNFLYCELQLSERNSSKVSF